MEATAKPVTAKEDRRRARRERGPLAVIDATVDHIQEGHAPPGAEAVAARAGVSVSSLFRYFDNLGDLQQAAIDRFFERYADRYVVADLGQGDRAGRIARYVAAMDALFDTIAPIARLVRGRTVEHPYLVGSLQRSRDLLADQVRAQFAAELTALPAAGRDDLVGVVSALTSFESWDLLRGQFGRTSRQVRRSWTAALDALLPATPSS
jgi:AcrR family transcriptional regulator